MRDIANILLGKLTLWGNPTLNCENGWATSCLPHLDLQFLYIFCGARLTDTKYWSPRLQWPYSIRSWMESVLPTPFLVSQKASSTLGFTSRPMCCLSYYDRHWPCRNSDLCYIAECYSTMFTFMFDHPLWWKSIIIIKNKPEPRHLHGIVLRLGGFHTLISLLEVVDHIMALIHAENTVTQILVGNVSFTGWWKAIYWKMVVLTKL